MLQGTPTLSPSGFTNAMPGSFGARVPMQWPPAFYSWFTEFDYFDGAATGAHDWMVTKVGAAGTAVVTDAANGILLLTTDALDNDGFMAQWAGFNTIATVAEVAETFQFVAGKELWFSCRFLLSEATQSDFICGLAIADTTPLDATDGVFFLKPDEAATLQLVSKIVTPVTATKNIATLAAATFYEFGFHYNGIDAINAYQGGQADGTWNYVGGLGVTALPTTELAVTFGFQNGAAGAKTCQLDYIFAARER